MYCHARLSFVFVFALLCACGGGGSPAATTIPRPTVNAPSDNTRNVLLGLQPTSVTLPVVSQISGTLLFPAVGTPAAIELSASAAPPAGVALESIRRMQSGTLTVYEYFTIVSPVSVSLPNIPAITLKFPSSTPLAGKSVYYGISDLNRQGGLVSFNTQGPGTRSGQTVSFAQVPTAISLMAGHKYTFVVYATTATTSSGKIYVVNVLNNTMTTYNADGSASTPTITSGLSGPFGVAVDAAGKIYVVNDNSTVTAYDVDGNRTTPTITAGLNNSLGVAVDATGKIYVTSADSDTVTTYNPDGSASTPTITAGLNFPIGLAVDAAGKIYVANFGNNTVTTYNADGSRTMPTITAGLIGPVGVALDAAGKIYVTNSDNNTVTTYNADGSVSIPTITAGLQFPEGVAVDAGGKIYVTNLGDGGDAGKGTLTTYTASGAPTTPTITGLSGPQGVAIH
jgi:DNA-binding beta-propeller fold protein YncE